MSITKYVTKFFLVEMCQVVADAHYYIKHFV